MGGSFQPDRIPISLHLGYTDGSIEGSMWQIERYLTAAHDQAGWAAAPTRAWLVNCRQKVAYTTPQI